MNNINNLFFNLIRVAIGTQDTLTRVPSAHEWDLLYAMAKKQSLVGICFAGVKRLCDSETEDYCGMSERLYFRWIGMAAKIKKRNYLVNWRCVELQDGLAEEGFRSCILKGQSAAYYYGEHLACLRQSGDIDVWVDASRRDILNFVQRVAPTTNVREHHVEFGFCHDTEVEIHFWPAVIRHFLKNRRLQKWFDGKRDVVFDNHIDLHGPMDLTICAPTPEFHAVQQMAHMYHHLFESGLGFRQVLDYFFVLCSIDRLDDSEATRAEVYEAITWIGMKRFAGALMYVLQKAMGLDRSKMLCEPNEADGDFLLNELMLMGNFGRGDTRKKRDASHYFSSFYGSIFRNMRYLRFNPFDWFWSPLWRLYYFGWRKKNGYH